jgi:hypothetical protein
MCLAVHVQVQMLTSREAVLSACLGSTDVSAVQAHVQMLTSSDEAAQVRA